MPIGNGMKSAAEIRALVDALPVDPAASTPAAAKPLPIDPPRFTTVGWLREPLQAILALPDDTRVFFGDGQLSFSRVVDRGGLDGSPLLQVEFNEIYTVTPDPTGG